MAKNIEITVEFAGEGWRTSKAGDNFCIGRSIVSADSMAMAEDAGHVAGDFLSIKGNFDKGELMEGCSYRLLGFFDKYNGETGFRFKSFVNHVPPTRRGVKNYLSAAGKGRSIGPVKASQLVDAFGVEDAIRICREEPLKVRDVTGIQLAKAESFSNQLQSMQATEASSLEVAEILDGQGFPKALARKVIRKWGNRAAVEITDNPYQLIAFTGVGYRLADKLYVSLGKDPEAIIRQALCLWNIIASQAEGHTWIPAKNAIIQLRGEIGTDNVDHFAAIRYCQELAAKDPDTFGSLKTIRTDDEFKFIQKKGKKLWLAEGGSAYAEKFIARQVVEALSESDIQDVASFDLVERIETRVLEHASCARCRRELTAPEVNVMDGKPYGPTCITYVDPGRTNSQVYDLTDWLDSNPDVMRWLEEQQTGFISLPEVSLWANACQLQGVTGHQAEQSGKAMGGRVGLLTGAPGTGKTYTVASIILAVVRSGRVPLSAIGVGAPTGKAAVRLSESLKEAGIPLRARTWHSLLGVAQSDEETDSWSFAHNQHNPWEYKILIGDESSMLDNKIMRAIFAARAPGAHMLFVGDPNQLPPVGNGAPFRDMIRAGIPCGELREIKRNSGGIVEACAKIRDGLPWVDDCDEFNPEEPNDEKTNLLFYDVDDQVSGIMDAIRYEVLNGHDPIADMQVICAVNKASELSRRVLNDFLQGELNPSPPEEGTIFREGDKVVCLKNSFFKSLAHVDDEEFTVNSDGEVYVANGELGIVEEVREKSLIVRLDDRVVQIPMKRFSKDVLEKKDEDKPTGCNWDLGYALSCHKFQGSEQKIIIGVLDTYKGARGVCDRSWIFTLISRAKLYGYLIGSRQTAQTFCKNAKIEQRRTLLAQRIGKLQFQREAELI